MKHEHSRVPGLFKDTSYIPCGGARACNSTTLSTSETFSNRFSHTANAFSASSIDDDLINFLDEDNPNPSAKIDAHPWKILITDDDENVHETTMLALNGVKIHGRPLEFLHAYSAKEAKNIILENEDIALVLLDVVMETVDAGLKLVEIIRTELRNDRLRIVLRTGQPGYAPEEQVSHQLAIDGYTTKSKLTRSLLISVLNDTLLDPEKTIRLPN